MKKYLFTSFIVIISFITINTNTASAQTAPSLVFSANPSSVAYNTPTTLSWTATNATTCTASNGSFGWAGSKSNYGGQFYTSNLTSGTVYGLTCTNQYGSILKTVAVSVNGGGGQSGTVPSLVLSANPTTVTSGGTTVLTFTVGGATSCNASGGTFGWAGSKSVNGGSFYSSSITSTTTFTLTCTNATGSTTKSVTIYVNTPPQSIPVVTVNANPSTINSGGATTINWSATNNPTSCYGSWVGWSGALATSGAKTVFPTSTTTYTISCTNSSGTGSASVVVYVSSLPPTVYPPIVTVTASPSSIIAGGSATLSWSATNNPTSCYDSANNWVSASGSKTVYPSYTTTYQITCTNSGGTNSGSATVVVGQVPQQAPSITSFYVNPTSVTSGSSATLYWSSTNATSCTLVGNGASGTQNPNGNFQTPALYVPTNYTLTCYNGSLSDTKTQKVGIAQAPQLSPVINHFYGTPNSVISGSSATLTWDSTNATYCKLFGAGASGTQNPSGTFFTPALYTTSLYTLVCYNGNLSATKHETISTSQAPAQEPVITNFYANPTSVASGNSSNLTWNSTNATYCTLTGPSASGSQNTSGSFTTPALYGYTNYALKCFNSAGEYDTANASISVTQTPPPQNRVYPTVTLSASPINVPYGGTSSIGWSTSNALSCDGGGGANGWSGYKRTNGGTVNSGALYANTTFTILCSNNDGTATAEVTVFVNSQQSSNPTVTTNGASNINSSYATLNGVVNANGDSNTRAWFEWGTNGNFYNQTSQINYAGNSQAYQYYLNGLSSNTAYSYRAVAQGSNGQIVYGNVMSFTTGGSGGCTYNCYNNQPTATTYPAQNVDQNGATLYGYVNGNGSSYVTRWFEWGTNYNNLFNKTNTGSGEGNFNQSIYGLSNNTTYYFRIVAQGNGGTVYGNTMSFTTTGNFGNTCNNGANYCPPTAVTTLATNIGQTSARLNGLGLLDGNTVSTNGYFEWGTTQGLGNSTSSGFIGSIRSNPFYSSLFGLAPGTTYYYRAVVTNQYGTSKGEITTFRTNNVTTTNTNTIIRNTTVVTNTNTGTGIAKPSSVFLNVNQDGAVIRRGDNMDYIVSWKNVSGNSLRDVVLRVLVPKDLNFVKTTQGDWSPENGYVVFNIGNLFPQQEGSITVSTRVSNSAEINDTVVITANIAYTIISNDSSNNNQEEVFAYSTNTVREGSDVNLAGLALFGDGFWPSTLLGWLLLLLIILIIIWVARMAYTKVATRTPPVVPTPPHSNNNPWNTPHA